MRAQDAAAGKLHCEGLVCRISRDDDVTVRGEILQQRRIEGARKPERGRKENDWKRSAGNRCGEVGARLQRVECPGRGAVESFEDAGGSGGHVSCATALTGGGSRIPD